MTLHDPLFVFFRGTAEGHTLLSGLKSGFIATHLNSGCPPSRWPHALIHSCLIHRPINWLAFGTMTARVREVCRIFLCSSPVAHTTSVKPENSTCSGFYRLMTDCLTGFATSVLPERIPCNHSNRTTKTEVTGQNQATEWAQPTRRSQPDEAIQTKPRAGTREAVYGCSGLRRLGPFFPLCDMDPKFTSLTVDNPGNWPTFLLHASSITRYIQHTQQWEQAGSSPKHFEIRYTSMPRTSRRRSL